jgi:hypothetical protein
MLNLRDALHLYDLVGHHIPTDIDEDTYILNFVGKIVHSLIDANEHRNYIDAIVLLTGKTTDEVVSQSLDQSVLDFSAGLVDNHILALCKFCRELGYDRTTGRR